MSAANPLTVGIAGFGAIGREVAQALCDGIPGLRLAGICVRHADEARAFLDAHHCEAEVITDPCMLARHSEVVVECLPPAAFRALATHVIEAGRMLIPMSVSQLLQNEDLVQRARDTGARVIVPTGAILGLDGLRAAREAGISSVKVTTCKPAAALPGACETATCTSPVMVFSGSVREGALRFPANVNVAVAVSLAGLGPDRTALEVWMDPAAVHNVHLIEVQADTVRFSVKVEGIPAPGNPKTSRLAALSAIAQLRLLSMDRGLVV